MTDGLQLATLLDNRAISYSFVAVAGLLDGLNPCAVGLILVLSGCVALCVRDIKRIARLGVAYIGTIFVLYFLIGMFFSQAIGAFMAWDGYAGLQQLAKWLLAGLLFASALYNVVHFYLDRKYPDHVREQAHVIHRLKKLSTQWPVAIAIGAVVTVFALPCSLPFYIGSITALAHAFTPWEMTGYLLVYDLLFVSPLILTLAVVMRGHGHIEGFLHEKNRWLHLVMAAASIALAVIYLIIES